MSETDHLSPQPSLTDSDVSTPTAPDGDVTAERNGDVGATANGGADAAAVGVRSLDPLLSAGGGPAGGPSNLQLLSEPAQQPDLLSHLNTVSGRGAAQQRGGGRILNPSICSFFMTTFHCLVNCQIITIAFHLTKYDR